MLKPRTYERSFASDHYHGNRWVLRWAENSVLIHEVMLKEQFLAFMFEKLLVEAGYKLARGGKDA